MVNSGIILRKRGFEITDDEICFLFLDGFVSSTISGRSSGRNDNLASLVLELIRNNHSITQEQISEQANLTRGQVEYCIAKLKDSGQIIRVGSTKSGHWSVLENG